MRGRKPKPTALKRLDGNPGKRGYNHDEPVPPKGLPTFPEHLSEVARDEWDRLAQVLHDMGVLTSVDRAALAAYCQTYGRWVEAEQKLRDLPSMVRTPSGYVQQNPWIGVANKQLELMGRYMAELGMTPASRSRVEIQPVPADTRISKITRIVICAPGQRDGGEFEQQAELLSGSKEED